MTEPTVDVVVVGLGFGEDFLPIYADHPHVGEVGIVEPDSARLHEVGDRFGIEHRYECYRDALDAGRWDAVHILAPVGFHADYSVAALRAGLHCACAVPMATELAEIDAVIEAQRASGRNYMMMETTVYAEEYRATEHLVRSGELGEITLYEGFHLQNLDGYPPYWLGYPPMKYSTHALAPILGLTGGTVRDVVAYGSGRLTPDRVGSYANPYPAEKGLFRLADSALVADITMSFFQTARSYVEGYHVHGEDLGVEWPSLAGEPLRLFRLQPLTDHEPTTGLRGRRCEVGVLAPDRGEDLLPEPLRRYVTDHTITSRADGSERVRPAEHGGSHPHLVHEFVSSIVEQRPPRIDAVRAAAWTAPGICAHQSALADGERIAVPQYG